MKNINLLKSIPLFKGLDENQINSLLPCLNVKHKSYKKDEYIFHAGDPVNDIGIVLSGKIHIIKEDYLGNRHILTTLSEKDMFAEVFVCAGIKNIPVTVYALNDSRILFIDYRKILTSCPDGCIPHSLITENMLWVISNKNLLLNLKIEFLSKRSIREKLLAYLNHQAENASSGTFSIPLSRQELADYLCVDRSALSYELGKLRNEGYLTFKKNHFNLTNKV